MSINPVGMPLAGGVQYGALGVQYYTIETPVNYIEENQTFASLAYREYVLGGKVDEIVNYLNNLVAVPLGFTALQGPASIRRVTTPSGFVDCSGIVNSFSISTKEDIVASDSNSSFLNAIGHKGGESFVVNGYNLLWYSSYQPYYTPELIILPAAPTSGVRQDFVFIEVCLRKISASSPIFFPYGCADSVDLGTISDPTDPRVASTLGLTSKGDFIQVQYRTRVIPGIDFALNMTDPMFDPLVLAQGTLAVPGSTPFSKSSDDEGLYYAIDATASFDSYVYAIPIAVVHRRNTGSWLVTNVNGTTMNGTGGNFSSGISGRPDQLYYDVVVPSDVFDMRHKVFLGDVDYASMYEDTISLLSKGKLATRWESLIQRPMGAGPGTPLNIYGSEILESFGVRGTCGFDSSYQVRCTGFSAPNKVSALPDGIRTIWADSKETQSVIFFIKDADGSAIEPVGFFSYSSYTLTASIDALASYYDINSAISPNRPQFVGRYPKLTWSNGDLVNMSWITLTGDSIFGTIQSGDSGSFKGYTSHPVDYIIGEVYIQFNEGSSILDKSPIVEGFYQALLYSSTDQVSVSLPSGVSQIRPINGEEQTRKVSTYGFMSADMPFSNTVYNSIVVYDGTYKLFYMTDPTSQTIQLSTSTDNLTWGSPTQVLDTTGQLGASTLLSMSVIGVGSTYTMYVTAEDYTLYRFDSIDGGSTWTKVPGTGTDGSLAVTGSFGGFTYLRATYEDAQPNPYRIYGSFGDYTVEVIISDDGLSFTATGTSIASVPPSEEITGLDVIKELDSSFGNIYRIWISTFSNHYYGISSNGTYFMVSNTSRSFTDFNIKAYEDGNTQGGGLDIAKVLKIDRGYYMYLTSTSFTSIGKSVCLRVAVLGIMDAGGSGYSLSGVYPTREHAKLDHTLSANDSIILFAKVVPSQISTEVVWGSNVSTFLNFNILHFPSKPAIVSTLGSGEKSYTSEDYRQAYLMLTQIAFVGDSNQLDSDSFSFDLYKIKSSLINTVDGFGALVPSPIYPYGILQEPGKYQRLLSYQNGSSYGNSLPDFNNYKNVYIATPTKTLVSSKGVYAAFNSDILVNLFMTYGRTEFIDWGIDSEGAVFVAVAALAKVVGTGVVFMPMSQTILAIRQSLQNVQSNCPDGRTYNTSIIPPGRPIIKNDFVTY